MHRFPKPYFEDYDAEKLQAQAEYREEMRRDMKYGPCSHCWSEPDSHGVRECLWCWAREKVVDERNEI